MMLFHCWLVVLLIAIIAITVARACSAAAIPRITCQNPVMNPVISIASAIGLSQLVLSISLFAKAMAAVI
jgi:hypothetical protein